MLSWVVLQSPLVSRESENDQTKWGTKMANSENDELRKQRVKEAKKISKHNGFLLAHYAGQAFDELEDLLLAQQFI